MIHSLICRTFIITLIASCFFCYCFAENETPPPSNKLVVDLREPCYSQGVISTEKGGVISGPELRIQARHIIYTRKTSETPPIHAIIAEGDLMVEFGDYIFVGGRLEYDFENKNGKIFNGKTGMEPWFFGGSTIYLYEDGSYFIEDAFVTTSQTTCPDWQFRADQVSLNDCGDLEARNLQLQILKIPVLWLPCFKANLDTIFDSPIRYNIKWGSRQGHRFGLFYELFSWNRWKTFLRLDYRLKHGPGGGIETYYRSIDHKTSLQTINYVASDSSIIHPSQKMRFRFQGIGDSLLMDDKISVHLSWDKLSDIDMPTDYNDRGLELDTAGRTELLVRRGEERWISNFITRLRINAFQTIKQELPTFETSWHPFELGNSKFVSDLGFKVSYLDFAYGNNLLHVHDYHSPRAEFSPLFYRNFKWQQLNITPTIGAVTIAYGNSPQSSAKWLALAKLCCSVNTTLTKQTPTMKHVITPYADYSYFSSPTVSPNDHYIFDIEDGWYRLDLLRFGVSQSLYRKLHDGYIVRLLCADLWANAFFDTHTFPQAIPKAYIDLNFNTLPNLRHTLQSAWDFAHNELDHYNVRTEWTVSDDVAVAVEYRHRSAYDWRKADHTNFILDSFRTVQQLRHSIVSDRRDTLLFHLFYRFHPHWAFEFESRHGWNRHHEPPYNEFEIDLLGKLRSAINFRLSYQHREDDDRLSVYMSIGINRPDCIIRSITPCLGF